MGVIMMGEISSFIGNQKGESKAPILRWLVIGFLMIIIVAMFVAIQNPPAYFSNTHVFFLLLLMVIVIFFGLWLMFID